MIKKNENLWYNLMQVLNSQILHYHLSHQLSHLDSHHQDHQHGIFYLMYSLKEIKTKNKLN